MVGFPREGRRPHLVRPGSGLPDELWWLRQQIADAFDGGGGGGWNFVMNSLPGAVPDPSKNVFTTQAGLMAALDALPQGVTPTIQFLGNFTWSDVGMPVSGWNMRLGEWRSPVLATGSITVTIPEGVKINSLTTISNGLLVEANPTATTPFNWDYIDALAPSIVWVLAVGLGACLRNGGSIPLIEGPGTGKFIVIATNSPSFSAVPPSTAPFVNADAPDIVIEAQTFSGFYGSLPDGWLMGSCNRVQQRGLDTRPANNPGATGPVVFEAQSILNPRAMSGAHKTLIFTNDVFSATDTDHFDDFEKLYEVYSALTGPIDIEFKQDPAGAALEIPAKTGGGFYQMKSGTRWLSAAGIGHNCQINLATGADVRDLSWVGDNVAVVGQGGVLSFTPLSPGDNPHVLIFNGFGAVLANAAATPVIDWGEDIANGPLILAITKTASITKAGGGVPPINITPTGAFTSIIAIYNTDGTLEENTISGSNGPGTALLASIVGASAHQSLKQPSWTGSPLGTVYQSEGRPRYNIQTPPLTAVGPYVMGDVTAGLFLNTNGENGSEFVRYSPTANNVGAQLPDPRYVPGQTVCFKEVSGAPAHDLVLTTPSGNIEGAAGPLNITPAAYEATHVTSDGTDWWLT